MADHAQEMVEGDGIIRLYWMLAKRLSKDFGCRLQLCRMYSSYFEFFTLFTSCGWRMKSGLLELILSVQFEVLHAAELHSSLSQKKT